MNNYFSIFLFHSFFQSGFYVDFFLKKISEIFMSNIFMITSQFFGEKYMIEVFTKKILDFSIYYVNKFIGWNNLNYVSFFFQIVCIFFYLSGFFIMIFLM